MSLRILDKTPGELIYALFKHPTSHGTIQLFRYGLVAIVAFAFDFGLLFIFSDIFGWFYLVSTTLAFAISVVVNYALSTLWVFAQRNKRQRTIEITIFIGICIVALLLNDLFMWIFTSGLGLHYLISKLITVMIVFIWSFGARRVMFHTDITRFGWTRKLITFAGALQRK